MKLSDDELVTVIVPAYNAGRHLDATLSAIRAQSYPHIEIIVVDDGSEDHTQDVAQRHARLDSRVRVIRQDNGGVAAARNRGLEAGSGRLVAPCDADDLWAPRKLEWQLKTWRAAGSNIGLVYSWYVTIDDSGVVTSYVSELAKRGDVFEHMCGGNLLGSGSAPLMRADAVAAAGGYDASLRARGAQGCEDFKLYLNLATQYEFGFVAEYCVGYRCAPHNMSGDALQILRSYDIVIDEYAKGFPEHRAQLRSGRKWFTEWLRRRAAAEGKRRQFAQLTGEMLRYAPAFLVRLEAERLGRWLSKRGARRRAGVEETRRFLGPRGSDALWILDKPVPSPDASSVVRSGMA